MHFNLKTLSILNLSTCSLLFAAIALVSCSKDDNSATNKYQLEGTWQLYQTTTGTNTDSIYELSSDNAIVFAPKFYWRYANGAVRDSGTYSITVDQATQQAFSGQIRYAASFTQFIKLKGDTLSLTSTGIIGNSAIYIKTADNSTSQSNPSN